MQPLWWSVYHIERNCSVLSGYALQVLKLIIFTARPHTAVTWHKLYAEEVTTAEPLHEVASKYIECLLTIQPASIAHVG